MRRIGVGILGAGRISDLHAIEYLRSTQARIVAVCDQARDLAAAKAAIWGVPEARTFAALAALLACDEVDLVEVLLPHDLHRAASVAALAAGKAVSVQKPMASSLADGLAMVAAAERHGRLQGAREFRVLPAGAEGQGPARRRRHRRALTIRIKSTFGDPSRGWTIPGSAQAWRLDPARCGGGPIVFDDGHHKFALAWWLMGMPLEVHAWIGRTAVAGGMVDGPAMISFRFPGSRLGVFEAVHAREMLVDTRHYAQDDQIEITGTRGVLWVTRGHGRLGDRPPVILYRDGETTGYSAMPTAWEESFVRSTRDTIAALREGRAPVLTAAQGLDVLRFSLAALRSAEAGRAVRLDEIAG